MLVLRLIAFVRFPIATSNGKYANEEFLFITYLKDKLRPEEIPNR